MLFNRTGKTAFTAFTAFRNSVYSFYSFYTCYKQLLQLLQFVQQFLQLLLFFSIFTVLSLYMFSLARPLVHDFGPELWFRSGSSFPKHLYIYFLLFFSNHIWKPLHIASSLTTSRSTPYICDTSKEKQRRLQKANRKDKEITTRASLSKAAGVIVNDARYMRVGSKQARTKTQN